MRQSRLCRFRWLAVFGVAAVLAGCGEAVTNAPATGENTQLCVNQFTDYVKPILMNPMLDNTMTQRTCAASTCHGQFGSGGNLNLDFGTYTDTEVVDNIKAQVNFSDVIQSPFLTKPLAGVNPHQSTLDIFRDSGDPCYGVIQQWLQTQVSSQFDAACTINLPLIASPLNSCGYAR